MSFVRKNRKAFVPYITAGDPNLATTAELVRALERAGADAIELGVPFSDPMADGPVNQRAAERALASGTTLRRIIGMVRELRAGGSKEGAFGNGKVAVPIILFTYYNPVLQYGLSQFARDAKEAGVSSVLIVDLPFEESGELTAVLQPAGVGQIHLVTPTTPDERLAILDQATSDFIYYVSRTGVTGVAEDGGSRESASSDLVLAPELIAELNRVRARIKKPVLVGFGVSGPEHARAIAVHSEGVVIGSAIMKLIEACGEAPDKKSTENNAESVGEKINEKFVVSRVRQFAESVRAALDSIAINKGANPC